MYKIGMVYKRQDIFYSESYQEQQKTETRIMKYIKEQMEDQVVKQIHDDLEFKVKPEVRQLKE